MISRKIVLVGDFATGKTSLIRRFVDNQFSDSYLSTIGVKISKKLIELEHVTLRGMIWDIEGGTDTKAVNKTYFIGAHGAILVADGTRFETLEHIEMYITLLQGNLKNIPLVLAVNKSDSLSEEERIDIMKKAQTMYGGMVQSIFLTSAKTGEGVEEMFHAIASEMAGV